MEECSKINHELFMSLENIWKNIGYSPEEINAKINLYITDIRVTKPCIKNFDSYLNLNINLKLKEVYESYIENEQETMEVMTEKLDYYKKSVKQLENELNIKLCNEYKCLRESLNEEDASSIESSRRRSFQIKAHTILEEQKLYEKLACELKQIKSDRLAWFNTMKTTQIKLCNLLDKSNTDSLISPTVNQVELDKLEERVKILAEEKDARLNYLRQLELDVRQILVDHKLELYKTSSLNYLDVFRTFSDEDFENKILSDVKIEKYRQSFFKLQIRKDKLKKDVDDKCEELKALYDILKVDRSECVIFDQPMYHAQFLNLLEKEVDHLKKTKQIRIKSLTEELKEEIKDLWDKCFCSDENKANFVLNDLSIQSDENYYLHLDYVQILRDLYKRHQNIFETAASWKITWDEHIQFEIEYSDPARFKKKSYRSLFEQQERKRINERLAFLKKSITNEAMSTTLNLERQQVITNCLDYIRKVENKHEKQKKEERQNKKTSLKVENGPSQKNKPLLKKFSSISKFQIEKNSTSKYLTSSSGGNYKPSYTPTFQTLSKSKQASSLNREYFNSHSAQKTYGLQTNNRINGNSGQSKPDASRKIVYNKPQVPTIKITPAVSKSVRRKSSKEVRKALFSRIKKRKSSISQLNSSLTIKANECCEKLNNLGILTNNEDISSINASSSIVDYGIFSDYIAETESSCSLVQDLKQLNKIYEKNN